MTINYIKTMNILRDGDEYGEVIGFAIKENLQFLRTEECLTIVSGMSWGQYCCEILDGLEEGDEESMELDSSYRKQIETQFERVEFQEVEDDGTFTVPLNFDPRRLKYYLE